MTAMFANARSNPLSNSGHLFEFKAGRSQLQVGSAPEKKKVVAEKTKGLVFIKQSNDQLMHFCWKNRETGGVVDDLIIFPGDTEFVRVKECPDGRVFMLKFKSSDERRLFWLQEPKTEGDADICTKVNDLLNKPPQVRAGGRGNASERAGITAAASGNHPIAALGSGVDSDEMGALGGLDQNQLMQLLQLMNSGNDNLIPPVTSGRTSGQARADSRSQNELQHSQEDVNQLSTILNNLRKNGGIASTSRATDVDLADVITGERVLETVRANNERLSPHLPTTEESPQAELEGTVRSPHFRQATDIFGHALQTGQLGPVLEQFSIGAEVTAAAATGNILEFAKKLTEAEQKESGGSTDTLASGSQPPEPPANPPPSEDPVKEPEPKRGKTDDNMDLD